MLRRVIGMLLLASVAMFAWADALAQDQERPTDYTGLSLQELLELDVISINVLGTHTHFAGEWMIAYRFMSMRMDGNRDGSDRLGADEILLPRGEFPVTPTDMDMEMHMAEVMYGPTDDLTLMAMLPFVRLSMDHVTAKDVHFTTKSEGVSDLVVKALYTFHRVGYDRHRLIINSGVSFPTGSIDEKDDTPAGPNKQLPYPMQLGSGTFDLLPGIAYLGQSEKWGWGAEAMATIRLGENSRNYTLGNRYHLIGRLDRRWTSWLSASAQVDWKTWGNIDGADPVLNPKMVPTADPQRRAGTRADFLLGVSLYVPEGRLENFRFGIEGGVPIYQSLDGPQLETDYLFSVGAQIVF
ncbi:transporter [Acidobacteria bacterium AH-259-L09]|nr:transporter [Acidobacteria bacterium AH-259-L09]